MTDKGVDGKSGHASSDEVNSVAAQHPSSTGGVTKSTEEVSHGSGAPDTDTSAASTSHNSETSTPGSSHAAAGPGGAPPVQPYGNYAVPPIPGVPGGPDKYTYYPGNYNGYQKKNYRNQGQNQGYQANQGGNSPAASPNYNSGNSGNGKGRRSYKVNQPNYNYAYPQPSMYPYGFVPNPYGGYQVMPNMQMSSYGVPIQSYGPMPSSKVKLTTKDGKPVDLEEKKKKTASSTPASSPAPNVAVPVSKSQSPAFSSPDVAPVPVAVPVAAPAAAPAPVAPAANSAAEEFKRKIREKAEKAAASKKAEEEQKLKAEKEKIEQEKAEKERAEREKAEAERIEKEKAEEAERQRIEQERKEQERLAREKEEAERVKLEEAKKEEEPKEKDTEEASSAPEPSTTEDASAEEPASKEPSADTSAPELSSTEDGSAEDGAEEDSFSISNFLSKVKEATPIDDIFNVKYPQDITPVDSSKKIPNKKYRYDPQFLIQFRSVLQFPLDADFKAQLEKVDIQTAKKGGPQGRSMSKFGNSLSGRYNGQIPGRGPPFNDPRQNSRSGSKRRGGGGSSRDKSTRKSNQSKRGGREKEEDAAPPKPLEDVKPLEKTENRWVPRSRIKKTEVQYAEDGTEILSEEDVERKVKSLLNKLTLEMFTQITDDVLKIANQSKWEKDSKTIRQIISLTFAKACDEPYWSEMYAKFCAKLCTDIPPEVTDETISLADGSHPSGGSLARRILLTTCQTEYEKGWTDKLPTNEDGSPLEPEMMSDEYYVMAAAKRRGLGLVKFIGHLYNLGMLNDQVIFVCLRDQCKNVVDPSEDSLENLAQLVKTVGPKLDTDERKKAILKIVFENIQKILDNVKLSSRIMFMLMDLQDLRKQRWFSDKAEAGPKTIEEIHRDAEIKRMEEMKANNEKKQQRRHNEGRSNSSRSGSNWNSGMNSGSGSGSGSGPNFVRRSPSFATQNNSFSNMTSSNSESNLARESSKRSESAQVNRFAALGDDDNNE